MAYKNRAAVASRIRDFRYAVRSGACVTAGHLLRELITHHPTLKPRTVTRLRQQINSCQIADHFRKRRSR